jgi:hypothetical protein
VSALEEEVEQHRREIALSQDELRQLATDFGRLPGEVSSLRSGVDDQKTQIATELAELRTQLFSTEFAEMLWRGNRDGFSANEFLWRCDGHAHTLTMILDTKGNIFGSFPRLEWEFCQAKSFFDKEFFSSLWRIRRTPAVPSERNCALHANPGRFLIVWELFDTKGIVFSDVYFCLFDRGSGRFSIKKWNIHNSGGAGEQDLREALFRL